MYSIQNEHSHFSLKYFLIDKFTANKELKPQMNKNEHAVFG